MHMKQLMSDRERSRKKLKMTMDLEQTPETTTDTMGLPMQTCKHWVKRKKRFCKMNPAKGKDYCGEHEPAVTDAYGDGTKDEDRIPCPLDGKHTIYKKNLRKHLKICNAREQDDLPDYIQKNVNAGEDGDDALSTDEFKALKLIDLEDKEFYGLINKVKELHGTYVEGNIKTLSSQHKCMDEELAKEEYGKESRKHLVQISALLGILDMEKTIQDGTIFTDFGAGKGQLAFYLSKLLEKKMCSRVLLIDRMSLRHKKENQVKEISLAYRIRADIIDLNLDKMPAYQNVDHCIAISKHLCGGATDLTLRCITHAKQSHFEYIMIALCCHHRCDWLTFVGKTFFRHHSIGPREFAIITKMVSWAICGTGLSRERRKAIEEHPLTVKETKSEGHRKLLEEEVKSEEGHQLPEQEDKLEEDRHLSEEEVKVIQNKQRLSLQEREKIGFMCKRLLDYARVEHLRECGYEASLNYYVPKDVTLENVVLLARKKTTDDK